MISNYNIFKIIAILLGGIVIFCLIYDFAKNYTNKNNHYLNANNSFLNKQYKKAHDLYKKASKLDPTNLYALEGQARSLMRLQKFSEAEKIFFLVLEKNINFVPALANLAILYDTMGNYNMAIYYYKKAIKQDGRVIKGMSWFNRFIKNIHFKPSNIEERLILSIINIKNTESNNGFFRS